MRARGVGALAGGVVEMGAGWPGATAGLRVRGSRSGCAGPGGYLQVGAGRCGVMGTWLWMGFCAGTPIRCRGRYGRGDQWARGGVPRRGGWWV